MSDSPFKEDMDAMAEGENAASHFKWEVSKHTVGFSESEMSPTQESAQSLETDTTPSISSIQEQEGAAALLESKEDLRCEREFCSNVGNQATVEVSVIPPSPPLHSHEQEEAAYGAEEKKVTSKPLRKLNGESHNSHIDNEFPALIRCFQVVNLSSECLLSFQTSLLHFLKSVPKHCSKHGPQMGEAGLGLDELKLIPKL